MRPERRLRKSSSHEAASFGLFKFLGSSNIFSSYNFQGPCLRSPLTADTVDVVRLVAGASAEGMGGIGSGSWLSNAACGEAGTELCSEGWQSLLVLPQRAHDAVEGAQTLFVVSEALLSDREAIVQPSSLAPQLRKLEVSLAIKARGR